jgi:hypothetical protein
MNYTGHPAFLQPSATRFPNPKKNPFFKKIPLYAILYLTVVKKANWRFCPHQSPPGVPASFLLPSGHVPHTGGMTLRFERYVALGDSSTEGLGDPFTSTGKYANITNFFYGWATKESSH